MKTQSYAVSAAGKVLFVLSIALLGSLTSCDSTSDIAPYNTIMSNGTQELPDTLAPDTVYAKPPKGADEGW
ncbi:MAG: hypothetical protein ACO1N1_17500 [Dyadobacter fermentans]